MVVLARVCRRKGVWKHPCQVLTTPKLGSGLSRVKRQCRGVASYAWGTRATAPLTVHSWGRGGSLTGYEPEANPSHPPHPLPRGSRSPGRVRGAHPLPWAERTLGAWRARPLAWPPPPSPHCSSQTHWSSSLGPQAPWALRPDAHPRRAGSSPPLQAREQGW